MSESEWKTFLTDFNRELLAYEEIVQRLPRKLVKSRWLGFPGASEEEIVSAEARLGVQFPPSYRAFLKPARNLPKNSHRLSEKKEPAEKR